MVTATVHVRQVLCDWQVSVVITEHYGSGLLPATSKAVYTLPLTQEELEGDPLASVLSAVARWADEASPRSQVGP
jgi:hypothetical protein